MYFCKQKKVKTFLKNHLMSVINGFNPLKFNHRRFNVKPKHVKIVFLIIFISSSFHLFAQEKDSLDYYGEKLTPIAIDSIASFGIALDEVMIFQPLRFDSREELKKYLILKRRTLKVYPYAKLAADRLDTLSSRMGLITNKRKKKIYIKRIEKFVYNEFEAELKKLSRSQGRILIKLVHRQTGATTHELIKQLRNGWRAFIYQTTASLFDLTLKDTYDPETLYDDYLIEDILQRANADGLIDLDASALDYDLDALYSMWKNKKSPVSKN